MIEEIKNTSTRRGTANGLATVVIQNGPHNWLKAACANPLCDGWLVTTVVVIVVSHVRTARSATNRTPTESGIAGKMTVTTANSGCSAFTL